jgi:hypothetical protein
MNCPHCQKELPVNYPVGYCPFCGNDFPEEKTIVAKESPLNWKMFFAVLFAPAVCSFASSAARLELLPVLFATIGCLVAGVICARLAMRSIGPTRMPRALLHLILAILFVFLCMMLSWIGCAVTGINR